MRNSCTYKIPGTKTFRLSSAKILGQWGSNLQNIEKIIRVIYVPDQGKIFVQCDQSGAEALIVAYLCKNANFRKLFTNGIKPHVYVAIHTFKEVWKKKLHEHSIPISPTFDIEEYINSPIEKLKSLEDWHSLDLIIKDSDNWPLTERYYYLAKQTCHSSNYGITAPTFRMNVLEKSGGKIVISKDDAVKFIETYDRLFPEIREWHNEVRRQIEMTSMLFNLHGHPYTITMPVGNILESSWKEFYAWIPQSSVGEITNIAYYNLQDYIVNNNKQWDLLANTHDSYLCQCPVGEEKECATIMKRFLNQSFISPVDGAEFSMKSESQAGFNWSPAKKDYNQEGLREV
jgi:DNA polymerase I-like protein with 3'-5' exonuclease and polymerase domains